MTGAQRATRPLRPRLQSTDLAAGRRAHRPDREQGAPGLAVIPTTGRNRPGLGPAGVGLPSRAIRTCQPSDSSAFDEPPHGLDLALAHVRVLDLPLDHFAKLSGELDLVEMTDKAVDEQAPSPAQHPGSDPAPRDLTGRHQHPGQGDVHAGVTEAGIGPIDDYRALRTHEDVEGMEVQVQNTITAPHRCRPQEVR